MFISVLYTNSTHAALKNCDSVSRPNAAYVLILAEYITTMSRSTTAGYAYLSCILVESIYVRNVISAPAK